MCSTSNLAGGVVKVGAYDTGLWATPAQARRAFFKGRCVLIQEPFFKRGLDGLCFIRVDQRDDIIFDIPDPTTFTKKHSLSIAHTTDTSLHNVVCRAPRARACGAVCSGAGGQLSFYVFVLCAVWKYR